MGNLDQWQLQHFWSQCVFQVPDQRSCTMTLRIFFTSHPDVCSPCLNALWTVWNPQEPSSIKFGNSSVKRLSLIISRNHKFTLRPSEEICIIFFLSEELQNTFPLHKIFWKNQSHKIMLQHSFESPNNEYVNPFGSLLLHCYKTHQTTQYNVKHYLTLSLKVWEDRW